MLKATNLTKKAMTEKIGQFSNNFRMAKYCTGGYLANTKKRLEYFLSMLDKGKIICYQARYCSEARETYYIIYIAKFDNEQENARVLSEVKKWAKVVDLV